MINIDINSGYKKISIPEGSTLLSGLGRNGILLPSACGGNARCGACKIKVLSGASDELSAAEIPLISPDEKAANFRLACQVKAERDLKIELPQEIFSVKQFTSKLIFKNMLTHDTVLLRLELIKPDSIDFFAGQYVQIRSQPYAGKTSVIRAYSIASSPSDKKHIELIIRKVPGGICSGWIFDYLKEGDKVYFTGSYGTLKLSNSSAPIIFIAGGSGMAPIRSMLIDMKEKKLRRRCEYFFGAVTNSDLFLTDEFFALQKDLPGFVFTPALSCEPEGSDWHGERGLVTEVVARHCPDCAGHEAYLCGSPGMVAACCKVLLKGGLKEDKIFYDKFV